MNDNPAGVTLWSDYGKDCYCALEFHNVPPSRKQVALGWMSNWQYAGKLPTQPWRAQMTVSRELILQTFPEGIRLMQKPIAGLESLHGKHTVADSETFPLSGSSFLFRGQLQVASGLAGRKLFTKNGSYTSVGYDSARQELFVDRTHSETAFKPPSGVIDFDILVDSNSSEVFAAGGRAAFTNYVIAGGICVLLVMAAALIRYPATIKKTEEPIDFGRTISMVRNPYALAFSLGAFLYVSVECAVYVWMPTLLQGYRGPAQSLALYAISIFFVLRAGGRFLGAWVLARWDWAIVLLVFSFAVLLCFAGSVTGGVDTAVFLLPLSGLFMSVVYPTINSKGISCFPKAQHGTVAGVILFFTCGGAALGPLAMGAVSDYFGHPTFGFYLATGFATLLFLGPLINKTWNPARSLLEKLDYSEYQHSEVI